MVTRILLLSVFIYWGLSSISYAQSSYTEHTLKLDSYANRPKAKIESMKWLSGYWTGKAFNGISEEVWSSPAAGSMMGVYRSIVNNEIQLYEFMTIAEEMGSLTLLLKHFDKNMIGWEKKDQTVDFPLVKMENDAAFFEGFTIKIDNANKLTMYVVLGSSDGQEKEVTFTYEKLN